MFYLDYNATSPLRESVKSAMVNALDIFGNASSVHQAGRKARSMIEDARDITAHYLGVLPQNIIFTASATEANHLLLRGLACDAIITSATEHDSVLASLAFTQAFKNKATYYIDHLPDGTLSQDSFDNIMSDIHKHNYKPLLSLMKVNNETGIIQNLQYFSDKIHEVGGYVHSDCVQALGKIPFDSWLWQCDAITLAGHKVGGCKGVGLLMLKENIALSPLLTGGGQEMRRRAGTENGVAITGFHALMQIISNKKTIGIELDNIALMRDYIEDEIQKINPHALIVAKQSLRVSNTICLISSGIEAEKQVIIADLNKVCISSGSACSSGKVKSS
ncbi:MAG: cysteine desulfurase, partial [Alphaproteobacteria bacterium]